MVSGRRNILIVGDKRLNGPEQSLRDLLRHAGHEGLVLMPTGTPGEVNAACRADPPLLVILVGDLEQVFALADAVLMAGMAPPPPIFALLTSEGAAAYLKALEAGITDVVLDSAPRAEVVIRVGNLIRFQQALLMAQARNGELERQLEERTQRLQEAVDVLRAAERRLNDQLALARDESRKKSELMATAAHELRTPLNAIVGFSDLIRTEAYGPLGDSRYKEFSNDIHSAASHMSALVDGTLDLAKAESGTETLDMRNVDIGRVVQDSVRMLHQAARAGGVLLDVIVPPRPLMIRTDPEKVRQVVLNLASNAVKFTPRGGRVTVEVAASPSQGAIIMVIRDTGIGIAPQDIGTAMRPFGQVKQPDRPHPKGTGLGLPLTRRFIEMLGGEMEIASQPGRGTVVTVRLPADIIPDSTTPERRMAAAR